MKKTIALITGLLIFAGATSAQQPAKGRVFNDANKNRIIDEGEKGIPGVLVSNQQEVVLTGGDGFYEIPVWDQSILFITKPAGYAVPLNENNVPQFYYIYYPDGSPQLGHTGIAPTGELPREINFPLYKVPQQNNFKVFVVADVQTASPVELEYFRDDVVAQVLNQQFDLAVSLGDIVHDDPGLFPGYIELMSMLEKPHFSVLGNHDVNYDADEPYSDDSFRHWFGPEYYSFDFGEVHFIVLENIERFCKKGDVEAYWDCYRGKVGEKQLTWLKNDLDKVPENKLVVICQHIAFEKNRDAGERNLVANRKDIFDILENRDKLLVLSGHKHTLQHDYFTEEDGWQGQQPLHQIVCASASGSWWTGPEDERGIPSSTQIDGVPNGYFIFEFNGTEFKHTFFPAGAINEQMRIESPVGNVTGDKIIVNVYNSNTHSTVTAEIDGIKKVVLKNHAQKDPFIAESFRKFRGKYKSWASPAISTQIWEGMLPSDLGAGLHTIKVVSVDEFKRSYVSGAVFKLE